MKAHEIALMRATATTHMFDEGHALYHRARLDSYGDKVATYSRGKTTICGLEIKPGSEMEGSTKTVITWDAELRLPPGYRIGEKDRFKVTSYRGEVVSMEYEVSTPKQLGMTANRYALKRVEV